MNKVQTTKKDLNPIKQEPLNPKEPEVMKSIKLEPVDTKEPELEPIEITKYLEVTMNDDLLAPDDENDKESSEISKPQEEKSLNAGSSSNTVTCRYFDND